MLARVVSNHRKKQLMARCINTAPPWCYILVLSLYLPNNFKPTWRYIYKPEVSTDIKAKFPKSKNQTNFAGSKWVYYKIFGQSEGYDFIVLDQ